MIWVDDCPAAGSAFAGGRGVKQRGRSGNEEDLTQAGGPHAKAQRREGRRDCWAAPERWRVEKNEPQSSQRKRRRKRRRVAVGLGLRQKQRLTEMAWIARYLPFDISVWRGDIGV